MTQSEIESYKKRDKKLSPPLVEETETSLIRDYSHSNQHHYLANQENLIKLHTV